MIILIIFGRSYITLRLKFKNPRKLPILKLLGKGGMGEVYLDEIIKPNRKVVSKLSPVLALIWYFVGDSELRPYKIESALYVSLSVLQLAALLGLTLPIIAFKSWKQDYWSMARRIYFSVVAFAGLLMIPFFYYWNLLGFRF